METLKHHKGYPCHNLWRDFVKKQQMSSAKSREIDACLQGIYKLSHSWFIVTNTIHTNIPRYILKGILIQFQV
jgi:hypothetical protein